MSLRSAGRFPRASPGNPSGLRAGAALPGAAFAAELGAEPRAARSAASEPCRRAANPAPAAPRIKVDEDGHRVVARTHKNDLPHYSIAAGKLREHFFKELKSSFNHRNYGFTSLRAFIEACPKLACILKGKHSKT